MFAKRQESGEEEIKDLRIQLANATKENCSLRQLIESKERKLRELDGKNFVNLHPVAQINLTNKTEEIRATGKLILTETYVNTLGRGLDELKKHDNLWILFPCLSSILADYTDKFSVENLKKLQESLVFTANSQDRLCPIALRLVRVVKFEDAVIYFEGINIPDSTPVFDIVPYTWEYHCPISKTEPSSCDEVIDLLSSSSDEDDDCIMEYEDQITSCQRQVNCKQEAGASEIKITEENCHSVQKNDTCNAKMDDSLNDNRKDVPQVSSRPASGIEAHAKPKVPKKRNRFGKIKQPKVYCSFCNMKFKFQDKLDSHIEKLHLNVNRRPASFKCHSCQMFLTSDNHLKRHYESKLHTNKVLNIVNSRSS